MAGNKKDVVRDQRLSFLMTRMEYKKLKAMAKERKISCGKIIREALGFASAS